MAASQGSPCHKTISTGRCDPRGQSANLMKIQEINKTTERSNTDDMREYLSNQGNSENSCFVTGNGGKI